jgi:hypothetical protein
MAVNAGIELPLLLKKTSHDSLLFDSSISDESSGNFET